MEFNRFRMTCGACWRTGTACRQAVSRLWNNSPAACTTAGGRLGGGRVSPADFLATVFATRPNLVHSAHAESSGSFVPSAPESVPGVWSMSEEPADTLAVEHLRDEQRRRWHEGTPVPAEELLARHPAVR